MQNPTEIQYAIAPFCQRKVSQREQRAGTAATELAIMLPLVLAFGLAAVDMGRFASATITLESAVRAGAERGATRQFTSYTYTAWESAIELSVVNELEDLRDNYLSNLNVTVEASEPSEQEALSWVSVSGECEFHTIVSWPMLPAQVPLRRQAVMRQFR